jgi:hypothetical protein
MKIGKGFWLFVGGMAVGGTIGFYSFIFLNMFLASTKPCPPKVAGVRVPANTYEIDFSKRYNLTLDSRYDSATHTYTDCLIKGFTQGKKESESSSSSRYEYFDTWLVVELSDGRMVYIPPHNIIMIEESKPRLQ